MRLLLLRLLTCWDDMEEAGLLLIADAVARPTGDDAVIEL